MCFNRIFIIESKKIEEFDDYMFSLRPTTNTRNPWFKEYWQKLTGCNYAGNGFQKHGSKYCDQARKNILLDIISFYSYSLLCSTKKLKVIAVKSIGDQISLKDEKIHSCII